MLNSILTIAKNTFRETIRDRILLSAIASIIAIILFTLFIGSLSLGESTRVIIDFSVTAIYILQLFVAIFIASSLIYKEVEGKTFYLILPKPISRSEILLGKTLGLTATTILVTGISTIALFLILFLKNEHTYYGLILLSTLYSTLEAILLIILSMLFSSFTSPLLAALGTTAMYFVGHAGDIFRFIFMTTTSTLAEILALGSYYLLPNLEKFNIRNDIVTLVYPSVSHILLTVLYAITYSAFLLFLSVVVFKKKDF